MVNTKKLTFIDDTKGSLIEFNFYYLRHRDDV